MSEPYIEARDFNGELYVSAHNLTQAIERARTSGAEHERVRLMSMMTPAERRRLRVIEICVDAGVNPNDVMGDSRLAKVCRVRQRLFYEFRADGMSYPEIGRFFNRDHTTVISGVRKEMKRVIETDTSSGAASRAD